MKKVMALIMCITLCFGMIGSAFANEVSDTYSRSKIYWQDDGEMDGNTIVDQVAAGALTSALMSSLGAPSALAKSMGGAISSFITGQNIVSGNAYIYYTVKQERGVEYNGLGEGYDKYYLRQTTHIYPNSKRKERECFKEITKTYTSSMPFFY